MARGENVQIDSRGVDMIIDQNNSLVSVWIRLKIDI